MQLFIQRSRLALILLIFPAAMAQAQLTVQNGAVITTNGNVIITLQDIDLIIDGTISQQAGDGSWYFTGSGDNSISGSSSPFFDKLQIAKTGSAKIILLQNITIAGSIAFNSGLIDLNNNHMLLQPGAMLNGENEVSRITGNNGGYIEATAVLNAPINANPGNLGAWITSGENLGSTVIRRGHSSQTNAGGAGSSILRYYDILPANNTALNATLRINYLDAELNGLDESALMLWKSTDHLHWTNVGYTARNATANYAEDSAIADFSRWTLSTVSNPLPIVIASFTVECLDGSARINWKTAQEQNSSRWDVDKSSDGIQWQTIASLAAAGNSRLERNYSYTDASPIGGTTFYRIAEFDIDGSATYSTIASANCGITDNDASMYPNPVRDVLWVTLHTPGASSMKIEIYDAGGARRHMQTTALNEGNNRVSIDMRALPPGLYFVHLQWENGQRTKIMKIEKD
ncbi:T9SS type A sorting domain-containing protein [Flavitalea sp. BT771]|uniref:T9SS type A sorting domain-containing protein n=1 Tax=Flavitalea sp. BT771 TaxID=3063329 RepID=UPI0026E3706C|nr:T9SS type A sorting domain-containing protein [Flavitalea sp. BT771]MDO6430039.1 T9SS type A sorting domain-containing protein [Flavitalea sp. BT771]MDV6219822.1 T9SS type A sorting domain-containing protein [Flavitalea sp. BT771]